MGVAMDIESVICASVEVGVLKQVEPEVAVTADVFMAVTGEVIVTVTADVIVAKVAVTDIAVANLDIAAGMVVLTRGGALPISNSDTCISKNALCECTYNPIVGLLFICYC